MSKAITDILAEAQANAASESAAFQALVSDIEAFVADMGSAATVLTVESAVVTLSDGSEATLLLPTAPAAGAAA